MIVSMKAFIIRWLVTFVAVFVASKLVTGITGDTFSLLMAALLLGFLNAFVRPVLLILSIPWIVVTMGLFILVLNALLLKVVAGIVTGFAVTGFLPAIWGAIIVSVVSWPFSCFFRAGDGRVRPISYHPSLSQNNEKEVQGKTIE